MEKYSKIFTVSDYECDRFGQLKIRSLFNYFQDMADDHADQMGIGYDFCLKRGVGWIGVAYHVIFQKLPKWGDQIEIFTWPSVSTPVSGIREFEVKDLSGGTLIKASSQWALIDLIQKRPVLVSKHIGSYELIPERMVETDFKKLEAPIKADILISEVIREDDIDINQHVNNAVYPSWSMDAFSPDFLSQNSLSELSIRFKKSAKRGDQIRVHTKLDESLMEQSITDETGDIIYALIESKWQKKE